jgi:ERCC4-type nuclease
MKLIIDNRELSTIPLFKESFDYEFDIQTIEIGDYLIYDGDELVAIIERKTWVDLSSTITGNRSNNHEKIITTKNKFNCKVFYLIEGALPNNLDQHCGGGKTLKYSHLLTHLDHLMMNYNFFVINSVSYKNSVERIALLMKNFISNKKKAVVDNTTNWIVEGGENELPKFTKNLDLILRDMIIAIPGVSLNLFEVFKPHLFSLLSGNLNIAEMKYPSGKKIGTKVENKIKRNINGVKILSAIKSISKNTAEEIIKYFPLNVILILEDREKFLNFTINGKKLTTKMQLILDLFDIIKPKIE